MLMHAEILNKRPRKDKQIPIIQISIPKAGTHLLQKCLRLIIQQNNIPFILEDSLGRYWYLKTRHLKYNEEHKRKILAVPQAVKFFIFRDPRDQLVSFIFYIAKSYKESPETYQAIHDNHALHIKKFNMGQLGIYPFDCASYAHLSLEEMLFELIFFGSPIYDSLGYRFINKNYQTNGIKEFYDSYMPWKEVPDICTIRFEDLVGPHGGGSYEAQRACIHKIAHHLGIELSEQRVAYIAQRLFGNTPTFREGKIGSWRTHFNEEHKTLFKEMAGQLLIDLGYESDFNW